MVLALLLSAQIASAAENTPAVEETGWLSGLFNSGKGLINTCAQGACDYKKTIAATLLVSGASAAAYYNWDRVQAAYDKTVAYVEENQEAIIEKLKVGGVVLGATGVVSFVGYRIFNYFLHAEVAPADEQKAADTAVTQVVENAVEELAENKTETPKTEEVPSVDSVKVKENETEESKKSEDASKVKQEAEEKKGDSFHSDLVDNLV